MDTQEARTRLDALLTAGAPIVETEHLKKRMRLRSVLSREVDTCVKHGQVYRTIFDKTYQNWKCLMKIQLSGKRWLTVCVAFPEPDDEVVLVTTYWPNRKRP